MSGVALLPQNKNERMGASSAIKIAPEAGFPTSAQLL